MTACKAASALTVRSKRLVGTCESGQNASDLRGCKRPSDIVLRSGNRNERDLIECLGVNSAKAGARRKWPRPGSWVTPRISSSCERIIGWITTGTSCARNPCSLMRRSSVAMLLSRRQHRRCWRSQIHARSCARRPVPGPCKRPDSRMQMLRPAPPRPSARTCSQPPARPPRAGRRRCRSLTAVTPLCVTQAWIAAPL